MPGPLDGLRVIDWTIWQQGPVASAMLADLGADVIKIESLDGGDPGRGLVAIMGTEVRANFYFEALNRGKKSIALDLKQAGAFLIGFSFFLFRGFYCFLKQFQTSSHSLIDHLDINNSVY